MTSIVLYLSGLFAQDVKNCPKGYSNANCETTLPVVSANAGTVEKILQLTFGAIAAIALIYIMLAALQFIASRGEEPDKASKARQTIIYAAIGLGVALSAEFIVTFVLFRVAR